MQMVNIRPEEPIKKGKYEIKTVNGEAVELSDIVAKIQELYDASSIKIKSLTFRGEGDKSSGDLPIGEFPVKVFGRQLYVMMKTNSFVATLSFKGHVYNN